MKKTFSFICIAASFAFISAQESYEAKINTQKISTKNHEKANGLNLSINYPSNWIKNEARHPHVLYRIDSPDMKIISIINIADILENASEAEKKSLKLLSDKDLHEVMKSWFPSSKKCSDFFIENGIESPRNSTCRKTKIEGIESSVSSSFGSVRIAEKTIQAYHVFYHIPYKNNLITISFMYKGVEDEQDRFLADASANSIMNTLIINNLWKK